MTSDSWNDGGMKEVRESWVGRVLVCLFDIGPTVTS